MSINNDSTAVSFAKKTLRTRMRAVLAEMNSLVQAQASTHAINLLVQKQLWKQASSVLLYAPLPGELDVWPLVSSALAEGKTVALPRYLAQENSYVICPIVDPVRDLRIGQFGIREPAEHCLAMPIYRLDLVLVPGVAFDLHGRRLGRGRGFYDHLLPVVFGQTCGVAYDEQIVEAIPVEKHDVLVSTVLTPTRWVECNPRVVIK